MKPKLAIAFSFALLIASVFDGSAQVIRGRVTDTEGQGIPGVSVYFKDTTIGTGTDSEGSYTINRDGDEKVLVFSFIGMKQKEETIGNRTRIDVVLEDEANFLNETVVIGYSSVQRKDLLGAVASVDSKSVTSIPSTNITESLSGKMAGVTVTVSEGDPDAPIDIKVRGTASITQDASPLYIVDGFPVSSISDIAAQDIKSIDVLKDAFSTAIYGSRGAYGVVLITTKDADRGRLSVSVDAYTGIKRMANRNAIEMMGAYDYARYLYEFSLLYDKSKEEGGLSMLYTPYLGTFDDLELYKEMPANDWVGRLFDNTGTTSSMNIQLNGSSEKGHWSASYTHVDEKAILMGSSYVRNNFSLRGRSTPSKAFSFGFSLRYSNTLVNGAGANSINDKGTTSGNGRLMGALRYTPIPMNYNEDIEDFDDYSEHFGANPIQDIRDNDDRRSRENWNVGGNGTWTILPGLKLKIEGGMDSNTAIRDRFYGITSYYTRQKAAIKNHPNINYTAEYNRTLRNVNTLSYDFRKVIKDKRHKLNLLAGQEYSYRTSNTETVVAEGFPEFYDADMARRYRGTAELISSSNNYFNENDVMLSFFGRANYIFASRYSISSAIRADASSKFAPANRWGYFPSAAVSWDIGNERFLRNVRWLDQLKFRYSYGAAGNNKIPAGNIYTQFSSTQSTKVSGMPNLIFPGNVMPNENLKWESTLSHNLGLDFALLKTRLSGTVELYHNTTRDLLINFPVAGTGYNTQYRNLGSVLNEGVELSLRAIAIEKKNFGLSLSGNISFNRNKVLSLGGLESIKSETNCIWAVGWDYMVKEGEPLGTIYGYEGAGWHGVEDFDFSLVDGKLGYWTPREGVATATTNLTTTYLRPGSPKFVDQNGDGTIDYDDKVPIGNALPVATGGFNLSMDIYGFDLSAAFSFSYGNDVYNANLLQLTQRGQYNYKNLSEKSAFGNAWTNVDWNTGKLIIDPNQLAEVNKDVTIWSPMMHGNFLSDYYIEDGSFLRLNSLTLGYTVPAVFSARAGIQRVRLYVTGSNLFCLTKYSGYDPEVNTRRATPLTPGVDYSAYPKSRSFVGGINISF